MRAIGDTVWHCDKGRRQTYVMCPDCMGSGRLTVIMGDGTHVGIDCECCREGAYHTGRVSTYEWSAKCIQGEICGMEVSGKKVEYQIGTPCSHYTRPENEVFDNLEGCEVHAAIAKAEFEIEEQQALQQKFKLNKNWAWNATYHRRMIRDAREQIEYHTKKLEVAKVKAKEPTETQP